MVYWLADSSTATQAAGAVSTTAAAVTDYGPLPAILFFTFAILTVGAAFSVALSRNIVRAAVGLLFALAGMSGLYFMLHAEFLAAVQLVVYVGGTLILMIFGVMLTSKAPNAAYDAKRVEVIWGLVVAVILALPLGWLVLSVRWHTQADGLAAAAQVPAGYPIDQLGKALLDPAGYLVPFELVSVLLLAVMIGAAYLAKSRKLPAVSQTTSKTESVLRNTRDHHGIEFAAEVPVDPLLGKPGASGRGTE